MRRNIAIASLAIVAVVILAAAVEGPLMGKIESPSYTVERSDGAIELRSYPALNVATTTVTGSRSAAVNEGFRILANYISGMNEDAEKIAMTAPVMQNRRGGSASSNAIDEEGDWTIRFVMPKEWPMESLPRPRDQRVTVENRPAGAYAVIRFSGLWRDALLRKKTEELEAFNARQGLVGKSTPIYAFYNPPWTLPFLRRNEVMIEVRPQRR